MRVLARRLSFGVPILIVALLSIASPGRAAVLPAKAPAPNDAAIMEWQATALPFAHSLERAASVDDAFTSVALDPDRETVLVYRRGSSGPPPTLYSSMASAQGIRMEFRQAQLSKGESDQLSKKIMSQRTALAADGTDVGGVSMASDGTLTIHVRHFAPAARTVADRFTMHGAGTVRVAQMATVTPDTRDWSFYGGAIINSSEGDDRLGKPFTARCTSGFNGLSTGNGYRYMITAFHCVHVDDPRFWTTDHYGTPGGILLGRATVLDSAHDMAYIKLDPAIISPLPVVWDGPIFPSIDQLTKDVTAVQAPAIGMKICSSGAFTGVNCYGRIVNHEPVTWANPWLSGPANYTSDLWYADGINGRVMVGPGDSGGPVFAPHGNVVTAVGIIQGHSTASQFNIGCPTSGWWPTTETCHTRIYFGDVSLVQARDINLTR